MASSDYATKMGSASRKRAQRDDLDYLIKDALMGSVRHTDSQLQEGDQRTWASVLQRAQTEVIQLPPADESGPFQENPIPAELETQTLGHSGEIFTALVAETGVPYNFSAQVNHYRSLIDMKIWCSVGALKLLGNSL